MPDLCRPILVIDDDIAIQDLALDVLRDEGFRVVGAQSHEEALATLAERRFALVLADTAGAHAAGDPGRWQVLEACRDAAGGAPVIIFSAHHPETFAGYEARGFVGLIAKPFEIDILIDTVRRMVAPSVADTPQDS